MVVVSAGERMGVEERVRGFFYIEFLERTARKKDAKCIHKAVPHSARLYLLKGDGSSRLW